MTQEIKIGDFIGGKYQYGYVYGVVVKILKNHVVINRYSEYYYDYTQTTKMMNVTKSRITKVGLESKEKLITIP